MRTQEFANAVGETYHIVRNTIGRPGRAPRDPGSPETDKMLRPQRRYVVADALAWRLTRDLCDMGLTWDQAAPVVHRERMGDVLAEGRFASNAYFAIWPTVDREGFAAWHGAPGEIAEMIESDQQTYGEVENVRFVFLPGTVARAREIAARAGYRFNGTEFVAETE